MISTIDSALRDTGLWPLPMPIGIAVLCYLVPPMQWINRGFTHWFHLASFLYALTQSEFIRKGLALMGISICIGWYAAITMDLLKYGNFFKILYWNMPSSLTNVMVQDGIVHYDTWESIGTMALSHVLDTLGHPLLTYYFWCKHTEKGGTFKSLLSWDIVVATWLFSRTWSLSHSKYNFGEFHMYYIGYDVYKITEGTLDLWYPAYITESTLYFCITCWKLSNLLAGGTISSSSSLSSKEDSTPAGKLSKDESTYDRQPSLRYSESSMSSTTR
ncbi:unnamed protein product [Cylindrotheca closterium]|uniref:Uncharacterized protein n=1 Tax=Cylindrotheca closterium TaxID=2856 RepID=A0AAD2CGS6_9STRA|nr:unnamed protein product [Cylindrotheca closterium]